MQYPQDGGVSRIRFHLREPDHRLAQAAIAALSVPYHDAGCLVCQCGVPDWWRLWTSETYAVLACGCNGSSLPLYIGPPPGSTCPKVEASCQQHPNSCAAAAITIGYPQNVPELGTLDTERAQEIVVALSCRLENADRVAQFGPRAVVPVADHGHAFVAWTRRLTAPYPIAGDEPWLEAIQRVRHR